MKIYKNFKLAGWSAIGSAVVTLPIIILSVFAAVSEAMLGGEFNLLSLAEILAGTIYLGLFIVMFLNFKYLLNQFLSDDSVDIYINILIWLQVIITLISFLDFLIPSGEYIVLAISTVLTIPYGIVLIIFGYKIKKLEHGLFGWKNAYAIFTMITGIAVASVILLFAGLLTSILTDVFMAVIFFKAEKNLSDKNDVMA